MIEVKKSRDVSISISSGTLSLFDPLLGTLTLSKQQQRFSFFSVHVPFSYLRTMTIAAAAMLTLTYDDDGLHDGDRFGFSFLFM